MCTPNSENTFAQSSANCVNAVKVESPWDYLDVNCESFIQKLLLFTLQGEQNSPFRVTATDILFEHFTMPNVNKYLKAAFSKEASELWRCLFQSDKDYVVSDAIQMFLGLLNTHKDALLLEMGPSLVFEEIMKLWWSPKFRGEVGNLLMVIIGSGSRKEVTNVFLGYEVLELMCQVTRTNLFENYNYVSHE